MQAIIESLTTANIIMIIGIVGAVVSIPIKDFLTLEYYDICDVFISLFIVGISAARSKPL
mgnify:CR=1 FL=1